MTKTYKIVSFGDFDPTGSKKFERDYLRALGLDFFVGNFEKDTHYVVWDLDLRNKPKELVSALAKNAHLILLDENLDPSQKEIVNYALSQMKKDTYLYVSYENEGKLTTIERYLKRQPEILSFDKKGLNLDVVKDAVKRVYDSYTNKI